MKRALGIVAAAVWTCVAACSADTTERGAADTTEQGAGERASDAPPAEAAVGESGGDVALPPDPETVELAGMGPLRRVGQELLFAGQPSPDALRTLAAQGYRTVLNTRGEGELDWDEPALVAELGMTYVQIPMAYPIESISDEWVERFDDVMREAERPMLLHCSSGNRVAGLWAVWLAEKEGVSAATAQDLGKRAGMTRIAGVVAKRLEGSGS